MIELKVKEIAENKGIITPSELARICGIHPNVAGTLLKTPLAPFTRKTFQLLCDGLGVEPQELFATNRRRKNGGVKK